MTSVACYRASPGHQGRCAPAPGPAGGHRPLYGWARWPVVKPTEVKSGRRDNHPELRQALAAKLDRLARNLASIANLLEGGTTSLARRRIRLQLIQ